MSYSDFTLKSVKEKFNLKIIENKDLFSSITERQVSDFLTTTLKYNVPLAIAIGTEKARSELIISNVLLEVRKILNNKISLFSGIKFDVDKKKSLNGFCDFIISKSPEQFYITQPVITLVEAKNESIISGLGQCIAEMYAANIFNHQEGYTSSVIYGVVTTGNNWKFLKYENKIFYIDLQEYYIVDINKIIGIFTEMAK